jgi:hypothetical protein
MAISPLAGPLMPDELKLKYFEKLKFPDLQNTALVCKNWFEVSCDTVLWKPIFKELSRQYTCNEGEDVKSAVLRNLLQDQKLSCQIIDLIGNEEQLSDIVGCPLETVKRFPTMLPIERSWHVIRGLSQDCTKMLQAFPNLHKKQLKQYLNQNLTPRQILLAFKGTIADAQIKFYEQDESLALFVKLLEAPLGPFDAEKAFRAAIFLYPQIRTYHAHNAQLKACAFIIKAHPDLSQFFKKNLATNEGDPEYLPVARYMSQILIPDMEDHISDLEDCNIVVTLEDWKKCGYTPPE